MTAFNQHGEFQMAMTERQHVLIGIRMRRKGESWFKSRITNLSLNGCTLSSFAKLELDQEIWVMFPGFEGRRAIVTWAENHQAGCVFDKPLHPAIFDHILRVSDPDARR